MIPAVLPYAHPEPMVAPSIYDSLPGDHAPPPSAIVMRAAATWRDLAEEFKRIAVPALSVPSA